jgi:hypothetical protein
MRAYTDSTAGGREQNIPSSLPPKQKPLWTAASSMQAKAMPRRRSYASNSGTTSKRLSSGPGRMPSKQWNENVALINSLKHVSILLRLPGGIPEAWDLPFMSSLVIGPLRCMHTEIVSSMGHTQAQEMSSDASEKFQFILLIHSQNTALDLLAPPSGRSVSQYTAKRPTYSLVKCAHNDSWA